MQREVEKVIEHASPRFEKVSGVAVRVARSPTRNTSPATSAEGGGAKASVAMGRRTDMLCPGRLEPLRTGKGLAERTLT